MKIDAIVKNCCIIMVAVSCLIWSLAEKHDFQLIQLGDMAINQFLLDKNSGRVWQKVCDEEKNNNNSFECDGIILWEEMYISDLTPSDSRPALIYGYIIKQREENSQEKDKSKK